MHTYVSKCMLDWGVHVRNNIEIRYLFSVLKLQTSLVFNVNFLNSFVAWKRIGNSTYPLGAASVVELLCEQIELLIYPRVLL